jgi:hypothetical protein
MTTITIRTDENIKKFYEQEAERNGLTLSGLLNLILHRGYQEKNRKGVHYGNTIDNYLINEAKRIEHDKNTEWHNLDDVLSELGVKYGVKSPNWR